MPLQNPWGGFREECEVLIRRALNKGLMGLEEAKIVLEKPPSPELGELSSSLCLSLARQRLVNPLKMAEDIVNAMDMTSATFTAGVKVAEPGYINFYVNRPHLFNAVLEAVFKLGEAWGAVNVDRPLKVIVEHTSVNPIHPIDIGHARNTFLGDTLARLLEARGHTVSRRYYVDDVGSQMATIAYGYEKLGKPKPTVKPDVFIGVLYTVTSCILETRRFRKRIENLQGLGETENASRLRAELDDWVAVVAEVQARYPELFNTLLSEVEKESDPEAAVAGLNRDYEAGREYAKKLVKEVAELCLEGFRETFNRVDVKFDGWDWESEFTWTGKVGEVIRKLKATPYVSIVEGALELDAEKAVTYLDLRESLGLPERYTVPSLTLTRADGTTLYTARDIAYSLKKLEDADMVVNVVGADQKLAQLQLRIALCILGLKGMAARQHHFAYGFVRFPGLRMSSRRGRYITLDNVLDEAVSKAFEEVVKRSPHLLDEEKRAIAGVVGIGAVKYAMVSVEPIKEVVFTWDRVLDFERNSAPFIQYAHARACNILKKAGKTGLSLEGTRVEALKDDVEQGLLLRVAWLPEILMEAADKLLPYLVADYANNLANLFNTFYDKLPVLKAENTVLKDARLALVSAVRITLRNAMKVLGIDTPGRM